ncbi:hypothetical protein ACYG9R_10620 [Mesorhizobium sp. RSR565B]|uniref:hypothetical protein n=1 Tax=Mesorhizobium sp. L103C565B0 TaxID=1287094 RepID=UPI0003D06C06|nr:hypothetical protein [Mesorhizobium sp. L103C565B0]ESZ50992.1 hypothetical protein X730_13480 [Mesorhizobium sp. L103C565B0]
MEVDFTNLGAAVAAWQGDFLRDVRNAQGEDQAKATAADLKNDPWLAVQWYVEDVRRGLSAA